MKPLAADHEVRERVRHILDAPNLGISREEIQQMAEQIIVSLHGDLTLSHIQLHHELSALAKFIEDARREVNSIRPSDIADTHIPNATDELGAIVGATEEATSTILDSCEKIEKLGEKMPKEVATEVLGSITRIYEACNFQDLTGQRIRKVVNTLEIIDKKVNDLIAAFSDKDFSFTKPVTDTAPGSPGSQGSGAPPPKTETPPSKMADSDLLHGPQLPEEAKRQAEIDAILASFN